MEAGTEPRKYVREPRDQFGATRERPIAGGWDGMREVVVIRSREWDVGDMMVGGDRGWYDTSVF